MIEPLHPLTIADHTRTAYIGHGYRSRRHMEWMEQARARIEAPLSDDHPRIVVQPVIYGMTRLWNVRRRTISQALILAQVMHREAEAAPEGWGGAIGIGHSNACELHLRAAQLGAPYQHLIFINPALRPDIEIPPAVRFVDVFYAPNDAAVVWGRRWRKLNPAHLFTKNRSLWGEAGRVGWQGTDNPSTAGRLRVQNWLLGNTGHGGALDWHRGVVLWDLIRQLIHYPTATRPPEGRIVPLFVT